MTTETIDVTGLPEPVVSSLLALVRTLRPPTSEVAAPTPAQLADWERMREEVAAQAAAHPRHSMTPEERIAALHRFVAEHAVHGAHVDISRESFYEGRE